jgi:hypothetical protein
MLDNSGKKISKAFFLQIRSRNFTDKGLWYHNNGKEAQNKTTLINILQSIFVDEIQTRYLPNMKQRNWESLM